MSEVDSASASRRLAIIQTGNATISATPTTIAQTSDVVYGSHSRHALSVKAAQQAPVVHARAAVAIAVEVPVDVSDVVRDEVSDVVRDDVALVVIDVCSQSANPPLCLASSALFSEAASPVHVRGPWTSTRYR